MNNVIKVPVYILGPQIAEIPELEGKSLATSFVTYSGQVVNIE